MKTMFGQVVFAVGSRKYFWEDVVLAAKLWGEWANLETEVRQGIACLKRMEDRRDFPTPKEVESAAREFRYARKLITAQETEAWLQQWGLTAEAWMEYIQRSLLRQKWSAILADIISQYPATTEEVDRCTKCEGICSKRLAQFAYKLAARAAVYEKGRTAAKPGAFDGCTNEDLDLTFQALSEVKAYEPWVTSPNFCQEKIDSLTHLERCFQDFCKQALTAKTTKDQISSYYLDWIRLDCRYTSFPEEQMAREAALCVREDGKALAEVVAVAKTAVHQALFYLGEMEAAWRYHFLRAQRDELLGPFSLSGKFVLFLVLDKIMPSVDDPDIRQRAEQNALKRAIDHEITDHVQWHSRL